MFSASQAYLIENGKVTSPVKGATIIGNGPDVLTRVAMVGNDMQLDSGIGTCGKDGQSVPVGVGQPTIRINDICLALPVLTLTWINCKIYGKHSRHLNIEN